MNGRDFTQLITLTPGVSANGGLNVYSNWEIYAGDNTDNSSNNTLKYADIELRLPIRPQWFGHDRDGDEIGHRRIPGHRGRIRPESNARNLFAPDTPSAPQIDITGDITGVQGDLVPDGGDPYTGMVACGKNGTPRQRGHFGAGGFAPGIPNPTPYNITGHTNIGFGLVVWDAASIRIRCAGRTSSSSTPACGTTCSRTRWERSRMSAARART